MEPILNPLFAKHPVILAPTCKIAIGFKDGGLDIGCDAERRYGPHPGRRVERHLENRSFLFGECAKSLDVVYVDALTSCGQHAALLPLGEQTAHGKQSRAGHLRQLLARKVDPERAVPVCATPQLVKQAQQLMTQPCRHLFRGNLAVTLLEFFEALRSDVYDIAP